ncbi:MAG: alpha-E domain-containing protein [Microbacterium sp.]
MLSRIAESLFWIGRYVERSDGTARILDVHLQLLLEDPWANEDIACRSLLAVLGAFVPEDVTTVTRDLVIDELGAARDNPSSIAFSIQAARENARRSREVVSSDLWECLNTTSVRLPTHLRSEKAHEFFKWTRERAALAAGVVEASTSRDEAWQFFTLGRALERADMTARMLSTRAPEYLSRPSWTTILRSCGAHEAYLRAYRGTPDSVSAAEFLLLDRLFPRSIVASLNQAESCVAQVDPTLDRVGHSNTVLRVIGRIRNELEYTPLDEVMADIYDHMENVQIATREASEALGKRFFPSQAEPSWIGETS